jgi:hypothetical protein
MSLMLPTPSGWSVQGQVNPPCTHHPARTRRFHALDSPHVCKFISRTRLGLRAVLVQSSPLQIASHAALVHPCSAVHSLPTETVPDRRDGRHASRTSNNSRLGSPHGQSHNLNFSLTSCRVLLRFPHQQKRPISQSQFLAYKLSCALAISSSTETANLTISTSRLQVVVCSCDFLINRNA